MNNQIISKFKELPKIKISWLALSLAIILIIGIIKFIIFLSVPIELILGSTESPYVGKVLHEHIYFSLINFIIFIPTLILVINSYRKGERSWVLWIVYLPLIILPIFLILIWLNVILY